MSTSRPGRAGAETARKTISAPTNTDMSASYIAAARASRLCVTGVVRVARRKLSDRVHAAAGDCARVLGWEVTGPLPHSALMAAANAAPARHATANRQNRSIGRDGRHE
jgi:hypothetical protein